MVGCFELHGYEMVSVPLFEFAEVVERGHAALPKQGLRFVEPESGEIVSLRPDMTPQIARVVATRLKDAPPPARLCYQGAVLRRIRERARRHAQVSQAGIELVGQAGPEGDLEVLSVAAAAARAAGLQDFVLDLGHARIATALVEPLDSGPAREILEALEIKDEVEVVRGAEHYGLPKATVRALAALPGFHGGAELWPEAEQLLGSTVASGALRELRALWDAACGAGLAPRILIDLAETRDFAYYTGTLFHLYAEGPGRAVGSGGRYDGLLGRFGAARPAVGFAFALDDLAWALQRADRSALERPRFLVARSAAGMLVELRSRGLSAALAPPTTELLAYARAWRYSHVLEAGPAGTTFLEVASGEVEAFSVSQADLLKNLKARFEPLA